MDRSGSMNTERGPPALVGRLFYGRLGRTLASPPFADQPRPGPVSGCGMISSAVAVRRLASGRTVHLRRGYLGMERFAISLSDELACDFDAFISELAYNDHAETARDLIRAAIEEHGLRLPETAQAD
jgi:hypothetical protein